MAASWQQYASLMLNLCQQRGWKEENKVSPRKNVIFTNISRSSKQRILSLQYYDLHEMKCYCCWICMNSIVSFVSCWWCDFWKFLHIIFLRFESKLYFAQWHKFQYGTSPSIYRPSTSLFDRRLKNGGSSETHQTSVFLHQRCLVCPRRWWPVIYGSQSSCHSDDHCAHLGEGMRVTTLTNEAR